ncbi:MAG: FkbM family methyltransferase [Candidatus Endobugula sp.]|jgi:FkbM family methyltransferase
MKKELEKIFHFFTNERFEYRNSSYGQEGEDLFLSKYFRGKRNGGFVDVGAHHPKRFSNTYKFYREGWRGVNIDAMPGSMTLFEKYRPEDINLEVGVGAKEGEMPFFVFNEPALNTFSRQEALLKNGMKNYRIIKERVVEIRPLSDILDEHWKLKSLDFMSVDVEGLDLEVLRSNNWELYRPTIVLVEDLERKPLFEIAENELVAYMNSVGYFPIGRTYSTLFFEKKDK